MIDIFNEVFTQTATALRAKFKGIRVTGEYVQTPRTVSATTEYAIVSRCLAINRLVNAQKRGRYKRRSI